jgi:hypothetical protein
MRKTAVKLILFFVGAHLLLGSALLIIEATHGINDQDASFAVAVAFHCFSFPSVHLLTSISGEPGIVSILIVGVVQWTLIALLVAVIYHIFRSVFRAIAGKTTRTAERVQATS